MIEIADGGTVSFSTPQCLLRPWRRGDETSLVHHANNRNIWINLKDRFPFPYKHSDAEQWIWKASRENPVSNFAIEIDGAAVGAVGLHFKHDIYRRSAEIGYWLGEEFWGRGIVPEAVRVVTEYAFSRFDLCRLSAPVLAWNQRSIRVLEKSGYSLEARLRNAVTKDNKTIDLLLYSLIRP